MSGDTVIWPGSKIFKLLNSFVLVKKQTLRTTRSINGTTRSINGKQQNIFFFLKPNFLQSYRLLHLFENKYIITINRKVQVKQHSITEIFMLTTFTMPQSFCGSKMSLSLQFQERNPPNFFLTDRYLTNESHSLFPLYNNTHILLRLIALTSA